MCSPGSPLFERARVRTHAPALILKSDVQLARLNTRFPLGSLALLVPFRFASSLASVRLPALVRWKMVVCSISILSRTLVPIDTRAAKQKTTTTASEFAEKKSSSLNRHFRVASSLSSSAFAFASLARCETHAYATQTDTHKNTTQVNQFEKPVPNNEPTRNKQVVGYTPNGHSVATAAQQQSPTAPSATMFKQQPAESTANNRPFQPTTKTSTTISTAATSSSISSYQPNNQYGSNASAKT